MTCKNRELHVYSEIGKLKTILLHRPGREIENLTPSLMERLLFADIPYLEVARKEHDAFANILRENGAEVLYLENLVAESIKNSDVKDMFLDQFLLEGNVRGKGLKKCLLEYFSQFKDRDLVDVLMAGIRVTDLNKYTAISLEEMTSSDYPFVLDPMPNLYFTRDPFASIGRGITLNQMRTTTRNRETIFAKYIFEYQPAFKNSNIQKKSVCKFKLFSSSKSRKRN